MLAHLISISTLVVVASTTCFDNGDKEIQGLCYKFVAQKLSYNDAVNWCHYQNPVTASFLAYVPNQFASNFLASYARTSFGQNDGNFWIGLSRATTSSPWKWDSGDSLQFTNFDSSQLGQNYAAESIVKSNWGTFSSDQKMNFVCSYNPSAPPTFVPNTAVPSTPTPTAGIPTTTTQNVPTTTVYNPCPLVANIAVAFELTDPNDPIDAGIADFITNQLFFYPGAPYQLGEEYDGKTALALVPYPDDNSPLLPFMNYGVATSSSTIADVIQVFGQLAQGDPNIREAFDIIPTLSRYGAPGFVILVANSASSVNAAAVSALALLSQGFQIITIAYKTDGNFDSLSSRTSYNFRISSDADKAVVASQIGNIIQQASPPCPPVTLGPCQCSGRFVFNGDLAIAFEFLNGSDGSQNVVNFLNNTLLKNPVSYGLTNDVIGNQPSKLEILPYPLTYSYPLFDYGSIRSSADIDSFITAYQGIQSDSADPSISNALNYIVTHPGKSSFQAILIVGSDATDVSKAIATSNALKAAGYLIITVAQTASADVFRPLASGDQYALHIGDGNDDAVAAQIGSLLLDASFTCFDDGSSAPAPTTRCPSATVTSPISQSKILKN